MPNMGDFCDNSKTAGQIQMIYVTSAWELHDDHRKLKPEYLVSILGPNDHVNFPNLGDRMKNLRLECDDVQYPSKGYVCPSRSHLEKLISFLRRLSPADSLMLHCAAGTSRSPAAALIAMHVIRGTSEMEAVKVLRSAAPQARPSQVFLRLADEILNTKLEKAAATMPIPQGIAESDLITLP